MHRDRFASTSMRMGAIVLGIVLCTAGLALAGVNLPDPARQAFERLGVSLPNQAGEGEGQAGEHARSDEVKAVIDATDPSDRGCEFGHRVAVAARGSALPDQAQAACTHAASKHAARNKHGRTTREGSSSAGRQFGQDTSERAHGLGDATVDQRRQFGRDTAERAKQLGGAPESTPAPESHSGAPSGPPADTPSGPPAGTPSGPPEGTPHGP
jgi:hypothetical protein